MLASWRQPAPAGPVKPDAGPTVHLSDCRRRFWKNRLRNAGAGHLEEETAMLRPLHEIDTETDPLRRWLTDGRLIAILIGLAVLLTWLSQR
jgi:hypothetical protein